MGYKWDILILILFTNDAFLRVPSRWGQVGPPCPAVPGWKSGSPWGAPGEQRKTSEEIGKSSRNVGLWWFINVKTLEMLVYRCENSRSMVNYGAIVPGHFFDFWRPESIICLSLEMLGKLKQPTISGFLSIFWDDDPRQTDRGGTIRYDMVLPETQIAWFDLFKT